ncbi:MAG TPA: hypothetical protein VGU61_07090 [Noviherbaspirillum sp.]|nr:hypothetical protein [Noviherbaspirillum sp.]
MELFLCRQASRKLVQSGTPLFISGSINERAPRHSQILIDACVDFAFFSLPIGSEQLLSATPQAAETKMASAEVHRLLLLHPLAPGKIQD